MRTSVLVEEHVSASAHEFVRNHFTWFSYIMLGYCVYLQIALGPLSSVFQSTFHLDYASTGIPVGAFAVGFIVVGLLGKQMLRLWFLQSWRGIWYSGCGMAAGTLFLMISQNLAMIAASTLVMGICGAFLQLVAQTSLADYHQEHRAMALTEANVLAGVAAVLAPLFVGGFQYVGLNWRFSLMLALGVLLLIGFFFRHIPQIDHRPMISQKEVGTYTDRLARTFWLYWIALVCNVAIEWSVIVWSAILLKQAGLTSSIAAMAVGFFFIAEVCGRFLASRLIRHISGATLLLQALVATALSFAFFLLIPILWLKIVGLFLTGLSIANLFPLTMSIALGTAPHNASVAGTRLSVAIGFAILGAPWLLGRVADMVGIQLACNIVFILLIISGIVMVCAKYGPATIPKRDALTSLK